MRRKLPPGTKQRVLQQVAEGKDPLKIAADNGVSLSSVNKWAKEASQPSAAIPAPTETAPKPITEPAGPDLSKLVAEHPGTGAIPPALDPAISMPDPAAAAVTPPPKPLEPEALLAMAEVAKTMIVQTVAGLYKVSLSEHEAIVLCGFSETEKKSLRALAPYAADYSGQLETYAKPAMALLFAGVVAFSTATSIKALKSKVAPKPAEKKKTKK